MQVEWELINTIPKEIHTVWIYHPFEGVQVGTRGLAGEWWIGASLRSWGPTHWAPFQTPRGPDEHTD